MTNGAVHPLAQRSEASRVQPRVRRRRRPYIWNLLAALEVKFTTRLLNSHGIGGAPHFRVSEIHGYSVYANLPVTLLDGEEATYPH